MPFNVKADPMTTSSKSLPIPPVTPAIKAALAPYGKLRVGINMANFLLVSGKTDDGSAKGVSPDLAQYIAGLLDVPCVLVPFAGPGQLADAIADDVWDLANIAVEPERAATIAFSNPYVLIDANFLTRKDSAIHTNADVDKKDISIILYGRSAYDLWLSEHYLKPTYLRVETIDLSHQRFKDGEGDVLASLKPKLLSELSGTGASDYRLITEPFTAIKQAVGMRPDHPDALDFINRVIAHLLACGFIADSLKTHQVEDKLSLPQ